MNMNNYLPSKLNEDNELYCIGCGKFYPKYQERCDRCLEKDTIEEGDW